MSAADRITVVLQSVGGRDLSTLLPFLPVGQSVGLGKGEALVRAVAIGDHIASAHQLKSQVVIAEAAMRRGALMHDENHLPALRRVINHVPTMYLAVADKVRQEALDDGSDPDEAEEMAGQAIRALVLFKQNLEAMLEPDLLSADKDHVNQNAHKPESVNRTTEKSSVVAETPYAQVRITDIGEWIRTVKNAERYEFLRNESSVLSVGGVFHEGYSGIALDHAVDAVISNDKQAKAVCGA